MIGRTDMPWQSVTKMLQKLQKGNFAINIVKNESKI